MDTKPTGRIRYRAHNQAFSKKTLLVLQLEFHETGKVQAEPNDLMIDRIVWRDASVEDMTLIGNAFNYSKV